MTMRPKFDPAEQMGPESKTATPSMVKLELDTGESIIVPCTAHEYYIRKEHIIGEFPWEGSIVIHGVNGKTVELPVHRLGITGWGGFRLLDVCCDYVVYGNFSNELEG